MAKKKKAKKEKVIYYDDNSTLVDMSSVNRKGQPMPPREQKPRSTFREKWDTSWAAARMMVIPMCIALLVIGMLFGLLYLITQ